jgi:hypothetical protein
MDFEQDKVPGLALPQPSGSAGASSSIHASQQVDVGNSSSSLVPPAVSEDESDALDQEWVNKAKAIVGSTKNDPYKESIELSKAKADYLRIRYSKHIKIAEDK